jgi:hypothetical protein
MFGRWRDKTVIPAILDQDIINIIQELGLTEKISSGVILCSQCGKPITLDNVKCIYSEKEEIKLCCNNNTCCYTLIKCKQIGNKE